MFRFVIWKICDSHVRPSEREKVSKQLKKTKSEKKSTHERYNRRNKKEVHKKQQTTEMVRGGGSKIHRREIDQERICACIVCCCCCCSLGIFKEKEEKEIKRQKRKEEVYTIEAAGVSIHVADTSHGVRAMTSKGPIDSASAQAYINKSFGDKLEEIKGAMQALAQVRHEKNHQRKVSEKNRK